MTKTETQEITKTYKTILQPGKSFAVKINCDKFKYIFHYAIKACDMLSVFVCDTQNLKLFNEKKEYNVMDSQYFNAFSSAPFSHIVPYYINDDMYIVVHYVNNLSPYQNNTKIELIVNKMDSSHYGKFGK